MPVLDVYLSAYLRYLSNYCRIYIQTNNFDKNTSTIISASCRNDDLSRDFVGTLPQNSYKPESMKSYIVKGNHISSEDS